MSDRSELSDELKKKFQEALKGRLDVRSCLDCPSARGFVQVVDFMIGMMIDATERMDIASQRMEAFIQIFIQLEEKEMMGRFRLEPEGF